MAPPQRQGAVGVHYQLTNTTPVGPAPTMSKPERAISPSLVRIVLATIATAIRAEDTRSALAFADAMLGRADYAPSEQEDCPPLNTRAYLHRQSDSCVTTDPTAYENSRELVLKQDVIDRIEYIEAGLAEWRTYAIEAGRQLAEKRQKNAELMELARLAAKIDPFGSVENAKVRDAAIRLLGN